MQKNGIIVASKRVVIYLAHLAGEKAKLNYLVLKEPVPLLKIKIIANKWMR